MSWRMRVVFRQWGHQSAMAPLTNGVASSWVSLIVTALGRICSGVHVFSPTRGSVEITVFTVGAKGAVAVALGYQTTEAVDVALFTAFVVGAVGDSVLCGAQGFAAHFRPVGDGQRGVFGAGGGLVGPDDAGCAAVAVDVDGVLDPVPVHG